MPVGNNALLKFVETFSYVMNFEKFRKIATFAEKYNKFYENQHFLVN